MLCYQFTKRLSSSEINCLTVKAHKCSLVNRRLGNCNLLVLVVIIAHLFQKVNNLQKKNYAFLFICYSSRVGLRMPFGAMVSSPDQTPQVPVRFFLIIHYFERPASSVRLMKSIHLRAYCKYCGFVNRRSFAQHNNIYALHSSKIEYT